MNTPKLRFKEFNDEWEEKKLEDVGEIITGKTPSTKEKKYWNGNIQFITPTDMQGTKYQYVTERTVSKEIKMEFLPIGTILFVCIGATIGKMALTFKEAITNQQINSIKVSNIFNNEYIYYSLLKKVNEIRVLKANTTMPIINKTEFSQIAIKVPKSPQEQQKIANFLSSIDRKIELSEEKLENFREYKKGIMQKIFNQELRFKNENENDYPEWEEKYLGEIGEIITGKTPSTKDEKNWNGSIQFVTPTDINDNKYQKYTQRKVSENIKMKILPIGTIMFTCIASIGKMSISTEKCITNQQINSIIVNEDIYNEYIYYALLNLVPKIKASQSTTTLPIINKTEFSKFMINLPCLEEQKKIVDFLSAIDSKIEKLSDELENLKEFKKGLLQQMFV